MITDSDVDTRLAGPDDLEEIGRLLPDLAGPFFPERFPGQVASDFCRWKYFRNPIGNAAVGVAMDGPRLVSIVAGVPKRVWLRSESVLAFELGDFITAPSYRKRGLFSRLIAAVCEESRKRGAAFVYVRPNERSFPILVENLDFREVQKIDGRHYVVPSSAIHRKIRIPPHMSRALGIDWFSRMLRLPKADPSVTVRQTARFGKEMDEFWESVRSSYSFALARDSDYLNWRYLDCPTPYQTWIGCRGERLAGYVVGFLSHGERAGHIIDLLTYPKDGSASAAMLRTAMEAMLSQGALSIHTWTLQSGACSVAVRQLSRACPRVEPPHLKMVMRFLNAGKTTPRLPLDGWQLASGDFDGV